MNETRTAAERAAIVQGAKFVELLVGGGYDSVHAALVANPHVSAATVLTGAFLIIEDLADERDAARAQLQLIGRKAFWASRNSGGVERRGPP